MLKNSAFAQMRVALGVMHSLQGLIINSDYNLFKSANRVQHFSPRQEVFPNRCQIQLEIQLESYWIDVLDLGDFYSILIKVHSNGFLFTPVDPKHQLWFLQCTSVHYHGWMFCEFLVNNMNFCVDSRSPQDISFILVVECQPNICHDCSQPP